MERLAYIVNTGNAAAMVGAVGDVHRTERTRTSEVFRNPLKAMYWGVELAGLVDHNLYLDALEATETVWDVQLAIEAYRAGLALRDRQAIPH